MTNSHLRHKSDLTQAELKRWLSYDPETGLFYWAKQTSQRRVGDVAGSVTKCPTSEHRRWGYVSIGLCRNLYYAHRLAWLYVHGRWPVAFIDHIDGDRTNNRLSNLRECTASQNAQARHLPQGKSSSFLGVCWAKATQKWQATINVDGRNVYLGQFATEIEAAEAYKMAKMKHHPFAFPGQTA